MKIFDELKWRGFIKDMTSPELEEKLNNGGMTFYIGTDPTGDSLHLGHLSSFLISKRLKEAGHNPILLIGGATGRIGDPRPTTEREMKTIEEVEHNIECLTEQVKRLFGFEIVNNYDWIRDINILDFLRDYGKYFNINYMLDKDIIRRRLETGITFTEFSYMLLQALDFLHLYEEKNCVMQVAGSDQWGNITAGVDLIKKKLGKDAYAFTMPLVTTKDGTKFGKSEGNSLWLDKNKTSSYELYQYLINVEDEMVINYLKIFTFLSKDEIEEIAKQHEERPEERLAHKTLAREVITFLHGHAEAEKAEMMSKALFTEDVANLSSEDILNNFKDMEKFYISDEMILEELLIAGNICSSKREARELINGNAISINNKKVNETTHMILKENAIDKKIYLIKKGKKKYYLGIFE